MAKQNAGGGTLPVPTSTDKLKGALQTADNPQRGLTLKNLLGTENVRKRFVDMVGEKRAGQYISSILSAVAGNRYLEACEPASIVSAAAIAASLDLPINPSLGFAHIVPYKDKAQFQMGWKGFVQLAQRTGLYKTLHRAVVYEGQMVKADPFRGTFEFREDAKKSDKVIGYFFYFELLNGFEKCVYWTKEKCEAHGRRYSQSFDKGQWSKDFDAMALKTVVKDGLSKWGPMSTELQKAITFDQAAVTEDLKPDYIDGKADPEEPGDGQVGGDGFETEEQREAREREFDRKLAEEQAGK